MAGSGEPASRAGSSIEDPVCTGYDMLRSRGKYRQQQGQCQKDGRQGFRALRCSEYAPLLKCFLDDGEIYDQAIIGTGARRFNTTWTSATERTVLQRLESLRQ